jgi:prepilin-type N-terminal cleavage/methylation domain-containing protein
MSHTLKSSPSSLLGRCKGFTLVELLVVIGIIALLISILLPALGRARQSAQGVACLSQVRQVSLASSLYINGSKGFLPPSYYFNLSDPSKNISLFDVLVSYLPKTASKSIYTCPSAIDGTTSQFPLTYGANRMTHVYFWCDLPLPTGQVNTLKRVSKVKRSSEIVSFADAAQSSGVFTTGGWLDFSDSGLVQDRSLAGELVNTLPGWAANSDAIGNNYHIRYRHNANTRASVVFIDGHAESVVNKDLKFSNLNGDY